MGVLAHTNPTTTGRPRVVAIMNGKMGNDSQVHAIAEKLAEWIDGDVDIIEAHCRTPALSPLIHRLLDTRLFRSLRRSQTAWKTVWPLFFRGPVPNPGAPAFVCGTLGSGEVSVAVLGRYWQCHTVQLGRPSRIPRKYFDTIIAPQGVEPFPDDVELEIAPTRMSLEQIEKAGQEFRSRIGLAGPVWSMLIGGDGGGYRWTNTDWECLGQALKTLAERHNIRWLLTTSRRTGRAVEQMLKRMLTSDHLAYGVWFNQQPERILSQFLGASERTFVTEESISMLSDAIISGRPVYAVAPEKLPADGKATSFVEAQERQRRTKRLTALEFAEFRFSNDFEEQWFQCLEHEWYAPLYRVLTSRNVIHPTPECRSLSHSSVLTLNRKAG